MLFISFRSQIPGEYAREHLSASRQHLRGELKMCSIVEKSYQYLTSQVVNPRDRYSLTHLPEQSRRDQSQYRQGMFWFWILLLFVFVYIISRAGIESWSFRFCRYSQCTNFSTIYFLTSDITPVRKFPWLTLRNGHGTESGTGRKASGVCSQIQTGQQSIRVEVIEN